MREGPPGVIKRWIELCEEHPRLGVALLLAIAIPALMAAQYLTNFK